MAQSTPGEEATELPVPWPEENVAKRGLAEAREALVAAKDRAKHRKQTK